jgi:hypothetical protein
MGTIDYLAALGDDGTALAAAARRGLEPPVPACAGWTVADVVLHTGMVHRDKLAIVRGRLPGPPRPWPPPSPPHDELLGWYEEGLTELLAALGDTDTGDSWRLRLLPAGIEVGPGQAPADATAAGRAADLLLWLWGRGPADPLERTGDPVLVPRVRELAAEATQ